ncbi:LRWD1-like protein [Mya arenaria]|uniref:LRWD1-like protein n=1 Tax=Mya arenaria TaxID=6604 RepID=A0ABY7E4G3_MYAAR|nr:LRWD1-like protein [Mya arenaria]
MSYFIQSLPRTVIYDRQPPKIAVLSTVFEKIDESYEMKGPPTKEYLLRLGMSDCLSKIQNIDLSQHNLTEIDTSLFNELSSLECLDISRNSLTCVPDDLHLPSLRILDIADNKLTSVNFVKRFKKLRELYIEDNKCLRMEDDYIARVLCPSLQTIDGAHDIGHIDHVVRQYTDQLQPQIEAVWVGRFGEVYQDGIPVSEIDSLHKEFVDTIAQGNVGDNLTLTKFRDFMPTLHDYDPSLFIRCHSKGNNPEDAHTKVWNCAFEPVTGGAQGETTNVVASCGGKLVCFVDCGTGKVVRRYKDTSKSESFFALAWTTLPADGDALKEDTNILAVGGQDEVVKLLHPSQLVMVGQLIGHRGGSRDSKVIMWKIGTPDFKSNSIECTQQAVLSLPKTDTISLTVEPTSDMLLAACESSCFAWNTCKLRTGNKHTQLPHYEFVHPRDERDDDKGPMIDGLEVLPNGCVATKCVGHGRVYVWNVGAQMKKKARSHPQREQVQLLAQLEYTLTEVDYLYLHSNKDLVIDTHYSSKMTDLQTDQESVVNCVAVSSSQEYLVSGTDNNLLDMEAFSEPQPAEVCTSGYQILQ